MKVMGYFVSVNNAVSCIYEDGTTNQGETVKITEDRKTVQILGEYDGVPGPSTPRLIEEEYSFWPSLIELSAHLEAETLGATLDDLRADLKHQLSIPDELDWSYLLSTAARALVAAEKEGRNMKEDREKH